MRHPTPRRTPTASARRAGYVIAVAVDAVVLYAANVWPGWPAVGFLNSDTALVMGLVNASLIIAIAANLCYLAADPPWLKALGSVITTAVGIAALVQSGRCFHSISTTAPLDRLLAPNRVGGVHHRPCYRDTVVASWV